MKTVIVYDSFFGNTEKIAEAVGRAVGDAKNVTIVRVGDMKLEMLEGLELLIVGSPTRAFNPSPAIKAFLKNIPAKRLDGVKITAFDTRIAINDKTPGFLRFMVKIFGYADKSILAALLKKGGQQIALPEGFFVLNSEGSLADGEIERAAEWAGKLTKG